MSTYPPKEKGELEYYPRNGVYPLQNQLAIILFALPSNKQGNIESKKSPNHYVEKSQK